MVCPVRRSGNSTLQSGNSHDLLDRVGFLGTRGALTVDGGPRPVLRTVPGIVGRERKGVIPVGIGEY